MNFGLVIVGDEILSGKRADKHFGKVVGLLGERGLQLAWAQYVGDDRARLTATLQRTFASDDVVFCCGGIGATPDDHTRQAAAAALGVPLALHPQARELITQRTLEQAAEGNAPVDMDAPVNRQRLRMGEFPEGAGIIPNPVNRIPGFQVARHWFVPGFPVMAWPMVAWVLDTHYAELFHRADPVERSMLLYAVPESTVAPWMEAVEAAHAGVRAFSLPSMGEDGSRRHIELGVKGEGAQAVEAAFAELVRAADAIGAAYDLRKSA